jgi:hypothetical protein
MRITVANYGDTNYGDRNYGAGITVTNYGDRCDIPVIEIELR